MRAAADDGQAGLAGTDSPHSLDRFCQWFTEPENRPKLALDKVYDTLKVQVISGGVTTTLATYSNLNKSSGYVQKQLDLTAYKGQSVTLRFLGAEDSSLQTLFAIDDTAVTTS